MLHGDLDFASDPWPSISDDAKDLVRRMLVRDPKKRLTAHEVLCESSIFLLVTIIFIHVEAFSPSQLNVMFSKAI